MGESLRAKGHTGDDRQGGDGTDPPHGLPELAEVVEGLEDEEVHAVVGQNPRLFARGLEGFTGADAAHRSELRAHRTDGARDPCAVAGHFPCQSGCGFVELDGLVGQPEGPQSKSVGAEGVGGENLGPGVEIGAVDFLHHLGVGERHLVIAAVDEHSAAVDFGSHGAIEQHHALLEGVEERLH